MPAVKKSTQASRAVSRQLEVEGYKGVIVKVSYVSYVSYPMYPAE